MKTNPVRQRALQLRAALVIVWHSGRGWMVVSAALAVIQSLLPLAALVIMKLMLDAITKRLGTDHPAADFEQVALLIGLAGLVALMTSVAAVVARLVSEAQGEAVTDHVRDILHKQSVAVDLEYYENAEYYNKLHRAQQEALYRPVRIASGLVQVTQNAFSLLAMAGLLLSLHWAVALVLFATVLPGTVVRLRYARILYRWRRDSTPAERQSWYYDWMLIDGSHAKEVRLFNLGGVFIERFRRLRRQLRLERLNIAKRRSIAELVTQLSSTVAMFGSYAFIAHRALQGTITLGDLVMYFQAFQRGQGFLTEMLRGLAGLYEDSLFLAYLDEFLALKPKVTTPSDPQPVPRPMQHGIEFHDVSFRYTGSAQEALRHVSLTIRPGEVVALVGANGAGKTTLAKLVCRLYDPTSGRITLDGMDFCQFEPVALRREFGVLFQDFQRFNVTARENIWFGSIESPAESAGEDTIKAAAEKSGAHEVIQALTHDYDTILGKVYQDGEELSIGQWQKVALARAFLRDSQVIVLDEPTSALDPMAEEELLRRFRTLIGHRAALLISHRLSTVKNADQIYVLDDHTIVDHGTHEELMARDGLYAQLFRVQAQHYV